MITQAREVVGEQGPQKGREVQAGGRGSGPLSCGEHTGVQVGRQGHRQEWRRWDVETGDKGRQRSG